MPKPGESWDEFRARRGREDQAAARLRAMADAADWGDVTQCRIFGHEAGKDGRCEVCGAPVKDGRR